MKFLISLFVVFLMIGFIAAPAMACDHDHGNDGDDGCGHDHDGSCGESDPDDNQDSGDGHGGCQGDSCHI